MADGWMFIIFCFAQKSNDSLISLDMARYLAEHRSWLCQNTDVLIIESMFMVAGSDPFASNFIKELSICNHKWFYLWWFNAIIGDFMMVQPFTFIFHMFEAGTVLRRLHGCVWLKGCNQCRRSIWAAIFQWVSFGEIHYTTKIHQPRWTTSKQAHAILVVWVSCVWSHYTICEIPGNSGCDPHHRK